MKKTSSLVFILMIFAVFGMVAACSKPPTQKGFVVGILNPNQGTQDISAGFMDGLKKRYDKKITIVESQCGSVCDIDKALNDLLANNVDLIFTVSTPATRKAKKLAEGRNIPVIFVMQDPVDSGLIQSFSRPGGNLTGVQIRGSVPKGVEWLQTLAPDVKNIFAPVKYDTKAADQSLVDLRQAVDHKGLTLILAEVETEDELLASLAAMPAETDAIFILCSIFIQSHTESIVQAAIKRGLPVASGAAQCEQGVTISYGMQGYKTGLQASRLAYQVLEGEAAGDLPAEVADFYLGINLKTARAAGLKVSNDILLLADQIIR